MPAEPQYFWRREVVVERLCGCCLVMERTCTSRARTSRAFTRACRSAGLLRHRSRVLLRRAITTLHNYCWNMALNENERVVEIVLLWCSICRPVVNYN